jgi:hypothetical protein
VVPEIAVASQFFKRLQQRMNFVRFVFIMCLSVFELVFSTFCATCQRLPPVICTLFRTDRVFSALANSSTTMPRAFYLPAIDQSLVDSTSIASADF